MKHRAWHKPIIAFLGAAMLPQAFADSAESTCQVWQDGAHSESASGDCMFSQRQGYIGITLADGSRFDLSPSDYMQYLDAEGLPVDREVDDEGVNTFTWSDRKIVLRFGRGEES